MQGPDTAMCSASKPSNHHAVYEDTVWIFSTALNRVDSFACACGGGQSWSSPAAAHAIGPGWMVLELWACAWEVPPLLKATQPCTTWSSIQPM